MRADLALLLLALGGGFLEVADRGRRGGGDSRGQGGGEDEAGGEAADRIHHGPGAGEIAAHDAEGLGQRTLDHVDPAHRARRARRCRRRAGRTCRRAWTSSI